MRQFSESAISGNSPNGGLRLFSPDDSVSDLTPVTTALADRPASKPSGDAPAKSKKKRKHKRERRLWKHPNGSWCIKVLGKAHYFGSDQEKAEAEWNRVKDDILNGREPDPVGGDKTLADLCNAYLNEKRDRLINGEISPRTFRDCKRVTDRLINLFGKTKHVDKFKIQDFADLRAAMAKTLAALALSIEIQRTKAVFTFAKKNHFATTDADYGTAFDKPNQKTIRSQRRQKGPRMMEAAEIQKALAAAPSAMKAMILLAVNGGMGNRDLALLPQPAVDLKSGWVNFPRPKTEVPRRFPLWKETVAAIREYLKARPKPATAAEADLLFLTRFGVCWCRDKDKTVDPDKPEGVWIDSVGREFGKLLTELKLKRPGLNFYTLRHVFRTIADKSLDDAATDLIMGHVADNDDMGAVYREHIDDSRLIAVTSNVRKWLFAKRRRAEERKP